MGRKPVNKPRKDNDAKKRQWASILTPYYKEIGLKQFSMGEVAEKLGVTKATIYKYFATREEILATLVRYQLEELSGYKKILEDGDLPFEQRYFEAVKHLLSNFSNVSTMLLSDLVREYPEVWQAVIHFQTEVAESFKTYYTEGVKQAYFRPIEPSVLVVSDRMVFSALSDPDFLATSGLTLEQAFGEYFKMRYYGILQNPPTS